MVHIVNFSSTLHPYLLIMSLSVLASYQIHFSSPISQHKERTTPSEHSFKLPVFESAKYWRALLNLEAKK